MSSNPGSNGYSSESGGGNGPNVNNDLKNDNTYIVAAGVGGFFATLGLAYAMYPSSKKKSEEDKEDKQPKRKKNLMTKKQRNQGRPIVHKRSAKKFNKKTQTLPPPRIESATTSDKEPDAYSDAQSFEDSPGPSFEYVTDANGRVHKEEYVYESLDE